MNYNTTRFIRHLVIPQRHFYWVPVLFLFSLFSCTHRHADHPAFFDAVMDHAAELRKQGYDQKSFMYEDSVFAAFPNPGIGDLFKRYNDRFEYNFSIRQDYNLAVNYADSLLWLLKGHEKEAPYVELYLMALIKKSGALFSAKKYTDSYRYYFNAKNLSEKTNPSYLSRKFYNVIGFANYRFSRYPDAIVYFKKVLTFLPDSMSTSSFFALAETQGILNGIGLGFEKAELDDSARIYYSRGIDLINRYGKLYPAKATFIEAAKGVIYGNLSGPVYRSGDTAMAKSLLKESIRMNIKKAHENRDAQTAMIKLAGIYLRAGYADSAFPVLGMLKTSLDSLPDAERQVNWLAMTADYYEKKNHIPEAYSYFKKSEKLKEALEESNLLKKAVDINNEFEAVRDEQQLEMLKRKSELNILFLVLVSCIAVMAIIIMFLLWRYWKQSRKSVVTLTSLNRQVHTQNDLLARSVKLLDVSQSLGQTAGWEYNRVTNEVFITRQTYLLYDLDEDFVPTMENIRELFNENEKNILDEITLSISDKKQYRRESELLTKKNLKKWVRIIAEPFIKDGLVVGSIGAIQDITLEKAAERVQKDLTEHLQTLIRSLEDIILEIDGNMVYRNIWVNDESMLFLPKDQLIGKTLAQVFGPLADMFITPVAEVLRTGITREFEYKHIDYSVQKWFKAKITLMTKSDNTADSRMAISVQDITAKTLQDLALTEAKEKLEQANFLLDVSQELGKVGGWEYDFASKEVFMTRQAYVIYEVTDDFIPTFENTTAFFDEETRGQMEELSRQSIEQRKPYDVELKMTSARNEKKWVRTIGVPVIKNDEVVGLRGAILDITEEKESELALIRTKEKLEQSILDKDRIMQILVHDLRSPLSGIHSVSDIMLQKTNYSRSDFEMISVINDTSLFLFEMVNDLVEIYLSGESTLLKKENTNIRALVQQGALVLKHKANEKSQQIHLHLDENSFAFVDAQKILRVLNNLIGNAIKFSPKNAVITITAKIENRLFKLSVEDQGIGIPPELKDKVFDVFTEAKRYGTNSEQPFGLGLSITKRIVEAHGGKIWFESEPGKSTTFFIEIPDSLN